MSTIKAIIVVFVILLLLYYSYVYIKLARAGVILYRHILSQALIEEIVRKEHKVNVLGSRIKYMGVKDNAHCYISVLFIQGTDSIQTAVVSVAFSKKCKGETIIKDGVNYSCYQL